MGEETAAESCQIQMKPNLPHVIKVNYTFYYPAQHLPLKTTDLITAAQNTCTNGISSTKANVLFINQFYFTGN